MRVSQIKQGDTYPLVARIEVSEDGVPAEVDFDLRHVACEYRVGENLVHTVTDPWVTPGVIDCSLPSSVSAVIAVGAEVQVDLRVRDENGVVRSTETKRFRISAAVSEVP